MPANRTRPHGARAHALARRLSRVLALGYLAALIGIVLALRFIGEKWWLTTLALYVPRWGFALPLPLVVLALAVFGPRRWLFALPVAVAMLLFPIMGLRLGTGARGAASAKRPSLRVLTCNVGRKLPPDALPRAVGKAEPDVVLLQEWASVMAKPLARALPGFHTHDHDRLFIASRHPLREVSIPPPLETTAAGSITPRYVRYRIEAPLGVVDVFNVHPTSPRRSLDHARSDFFRGGGPAAIAANADLRRRQIAALRAAVTGSPHPVIIGGDTNLPGLSWILATHLGDFADGFAEAGRGFGYTFPSHHPWMRIDRVLVDDRLSFRRFETIDSVASDHMCVWADVARR